MLAGQRYGDTPLRPDIMQAGSALRVSVPRKRVV
jgi:hypothetical protein